MLKLNRATASDFARALVARGAGAPLALFANIVLARTLGAPEYGRYLTLLSSALVAASIASFGVSEVITRVIAAEPLSTQTSAARAVMRWATTLTARYAVLAMILLAGWLAFGPWAPRAGWSQRILATALVLPAVWTIIFPAGLAGLMRVPQSEAIANSIKNGLLVVAALVIAALPQATTGDALLGQLISTALAGMVGYTWFRHYTQRDSTRRVAIAITEHLSSNRSSWWRSSAYFLSMSVASIALLRLDVVIVNAFSNEAQAGLFGAAARLAQAAQVIGLAWMVWLRPRIASTVARSDRQRLARLLRMGTVGVTSMAGLATAIAWMAAVPLISLFGPEFRAAVWPFRLLLLANLAWCTVVPLYTLLAMSGSERVVSRLVWAQLVLTLGLSVPLCHSLGATGAAYAWAAGSWAWAAAVAIVAVRAHVSMSAGREPA